MLAAAPARAEPDPGVALVVGTATMLLGFAVGATVTATANGSKRPTNTGWLIMESGFIVAPFAAHATQGEWTRGLAFSALPAAAMGGTVGLFDYSPGTVLHGTLVQQRILWGLFGTGLVSSVIVSRRRDPRPNPTPDRSPSRPWSRRGRWGSSSGGLCESAHRPRRPRPSRGRVRHRAPEPARPPRGPMMTLTEEPLDDRPAPEALRHARRGRRRRTAPTRAVVAGCQ